MPPESTVSQHRPRRRRRRHRERGGVTFAHGSRSERGHLSNPAEMIIEYSRGKTSGRDKRHSFGLRSRAWKSRIRLSCKWATNSGERADKTHQRACNMRGAELLDPTQKSRIKVHPTVHIRLPRTSFVMVQCRALFYRRHLPGGGGGKSFASL